MPLSPADLPELATLAREAARRAATLVRGEAGKAHEVRRKEGPGSEAARVVTSVDLASQDLILEALGDSIRTHRFGLLTEEHPDDQSRHTREYFWCIDPLDGTLPFLENVAGYSVSIALVSRGGRPVVGAIADPVSGTLYHAHLGGGAFRNGKRWDVPVPSNARPPELTLVMDRSLAGHPRFDLLLERVRDLADQRGLAGVRLINQGGAAMNACWVIEQAPALYLKPPKPEPGGGSLWDFAASACLFAELGAVATDFRGAPLKLNRAGGTTMNEDGVLFASDPGLAEALRA